jgi:ATP-binding cassette, subfamily G (WHITE), member 2, SNQ2
MPTHPSGVLTHRCSLVFAGILSNEFMRIDLTCNGNYVVPRNPPGVTKYPLGIGPNQICTAFGATAGSIIVRGRDYLKVSFGIDAADIWRRNFLVLCGWLVFFQITQLVAIEFFQVCPRFY